MLSGLIRLMEVCVSSDARSINKSVYSVPLYHYAAMTPSSSSDQYTLWDSHMLLPLTSTMLEFQKTDSISENMPRNVLSRAIIMENDISGSLWDLTVKLLQQLKVLTYSMQTYDLCLGAASVLLLHIKRHTTDMHHMVFVVNSDWSLTAERIGKHIASKRQIIS